jgi:hypothetical protein
LLLLLLLQMAATLEEIREKNRQLAESNLSKQNAINEVRRSTGHGLLYLDAITDKGRSSRSICCYVAVY